MLSELPEFWGWGVVGANLLHQHHSIHSTELYLLVVALQSRQDSVLLPCLHFFYHSLHVHVHVVDRASCFSPLGCTCCGFPPPPVRPTAPAVLNPPLQRRLPLRICLGDALTSRKRRNSHQLHSTGNEDSLILLQWNFICHVWIKLFWIFKPV